MKRFFNPGRIFQALCRQVVFYTKPFGGNRGLSLVELITALGIFTVLSSVSFVTFRKQTLKAELVNFVDTAKSVQTSFKSCIASSGWKVTRPDGTTVYPCSALEKIGWKKAPSSIDGMGSQPDSTSESAATYFCTDFHLEAQGKKYQIQVSFKLEDLETEIKCDQVTDYTTTPCTHTAHTTLAHNCSGKAKDAIKELLK